ncbi:SCP2 sterol-binding domain-containing protein [Paraliomyxa miuraensis]|uniref:SCP2 sterol-binding domain-containing protein n=1 Tax=Paraliomyxa miuraensis TaxID=376150 RepID=UPI002253ADB3|nr:SCP2 sterol-binding domain-containing protein [Paraliomyxa miuraensis]MCX4247949.1 SCP2 sterol-binding domain-containing protein [Paraliomyxa miuraensis]
MGIRDLTDTIRRKVGLDSKLGAVLKFDLGDDGVIRIDATESPNRVSNEDGDAQCTVHMSRADLDDMLRGKLDPMAAFGQGRLRLEGDMSVAMKLGDLVRGG